jgi:L-iditol 2-dehydrogenase
MAKVLRLHGVGDLRLHDEPLPAPGPDDVLVRVTAAGICGSDLHWLAEAGIGSERLRRPLVLGHEFAGVIDSGERRGQRVAVDPAIPCGACELCQAGHPNLCTALHFAGQGTDEGALREYLAWPSRCLHPLPDAVSDADGAMLEPLGVAIHAVDLGHLHGGMSVAVLGCGPVGLLILQLARAMGAARLIATDILSHRLEAARLLAKAEAVQADGGREAGEIVAATGGRGVDVAFEAAGDNDAVEAAVASLRPGGCLVLVGIPADDRTAFSASAARRKGLTIRLSRRMKHTYPRAIRLVEDGAVEVRSLVTHRLPLAEFERAFDVARRREGLKVIVEP